MKNKHYALLTTVLCLLLASGCAAPLQQTTTEKPTAASLKDRAKTSEDYAIVIAKASDTYESLAEIYYGHKDLAYLIAEFNKNNPIVADAVIVVPLKPSNPGGLYPDGHQTVPVLCYHQFSKKKSKTKISLSEDMFDQQMAYLKDNGYSVITLDTLYEFIAYKRRPPKNAVVITIDDGWKSTRTVAAPILKKYGFKATLFVYTDLIKSKPNQTTLSWNEISEMMDEGVIDVQSHTVSHADLTKLSPEQMEREVADSQRIIQENIGKKTVYHAYPYGSFNEKVIETLKKSGFLAAFTVARGSNAFFNNNFSLNRHVVFNSEKIEDFTKLLETFKKE